MTQESIYNPATERYDFNEDAETERLNRFYSALKRLRELEDAEASIGDDDSDRTPRPEISRLKKRALDTFLDGVKDEIDLLIEETDEKKTRDLIIKITQEVVRFYQLFY